MPRLGQLGLQLGDRARATHQLGLGRGDLLGRLPLLCLGQFPDLVTVLDGVLDQLLHRVQVRITHGGQLDRRQVEVVLDAVLDAHGHQGIQAEFDQRHLPGQILGFVAHGTADDGAQPVGHRLTGVRGPLGEVRPDIRSGGEVIGLERRRRRLLLHH